jgi:hypothetical protein
LVVNYGAQKFKDKAKEYTRTWSTTNTPTDAPTDFYAHFANFTNDKAVSAEKQTFNVFNPMKEAKSCIHYTRYENTPRLASDFLATVTYDPAQPYIITIRPLRIFYKDFSSLVAESDSEHVAVKIAFSADVTYLERQQGIIAKGAIDGTILEAEFDRNKLHNPNDSIYVLYKDTTPGLTAPLPPWTLEWKAEEGAAGPAPATAAAPLPAQTGVAAPQDENVPWPQHSRLSATISVSEVGSVPRSLEAADWFEKNKVDATKLFTSLLQAFAGNVDGLKSSPASTGGGAHAPAQ